MPDPSQSTLDAPASSPFTPRKLDVERLNKVADMIQSHPEHFNMDWFLSREGGTGSCWPQDIAGADLFECGTTACIAGWAVALWGAEVGPKDTDIDATAARILGMDKDEAGVLLFYADPLFHMTADQAADHLRRMALDFERVNGGDAGASDDTRIGGRA